MAQILHYPGSFVGMLNSEKTSSSTTTHVRAREELQGFGGGEPREEIYAAYHEVFGRRILGPMISDVDHLLSMGIDPAVIVAAIEETAVAPMPSWRYTMAILRRCISGGITSVEAWKADKQSFSARTSRRSAPADSAPPVKKTVTQQQYTQRRPHESSLEDDVKAYMAQYM